MPAVEFLPAARDDLKALDKPVAQRILKKIRWLAENFAQITPQPLVGDWHGFFKFRVGDYRVIYTLSPDSTSTLFIHFVKHRREVYKS